MRLRTHPGFRLFWAASTVSDFGSEITTLALRVLVVTTLAGSSADVGLVNAARWVPYLLFGVLVGALADRVRRRPLLVGTDLVRAGLLRIEVEDRPAPARAPLRREMREAMAWVYGHRMLRPLALITHGWTLFAAFVGAVYVPYGLKELGFSPLGLGITLAAAGIGGLLGSGLSERLGRRPGRTVPAAWVLGAVGVAVVALAPVGGLAVVAAGQFLSGTALGLSSPLELSFRQAVTPDRLQARMNATMRSFNRAAVVIGAPTGGLIADTYGYRPALGLAAAGTAAAGLALAASPFRNA